MLNGYKFGKYAIFIAVGYFGLRAGNLPPPPTLQGMCPKKLALDPEMYLYFNEKLRQFNCQVLPVI